MHDFDQLFILEIPLIDVRAPVEFADGAFPTAVNLPILDDAERQQIGICHKESGPEAAVKLGHKLISGQVKEERIAQWLKFIDEHPTAQLYCFRGGQRSEIACNWLKDAGIEINRIPGGYKQLRNCLLAVFEALPPLVIVSGQTGTGKTRFLDSFDNAIDLEGLANHRGSAFGGKISSQPCQVDFENSVSIGFLKQAPRQVLLEDESRLIGKLLLPPSLQASMSDAPLIVIEEPLSVRVEQIYEEYIEQQWQDYTSHHGESAADAFSMYLLTALDAIKKRLGGEAHERIRTLVVNALEKQIKHGDSSGHREWISTLLTDYYDPMYSYQLGKKAARVKFTGCREEVVSWYEEYRADNV